MRTLTIQEIYNLFLKFETKYFNRAKKTKYLKIKMIEMKSMRLKTLKKSHKKHANMIILFKICFDLFMGREEILNNKLHNF